MDTCGFWKNEGIILCYECESIRLLHGLFVDGRVVSTRFGRFALTVTWWFSDIFRIFSRVVNWCHVFDEVVGICHLLMGAFRGAFITQFVSWVVSGTVADRTGWGE